jgi:hypothetical protein
MEFSVSWNSFQSLLLLSEPVNVSKWELRGQFQSGSMFEWL